MEHLHAMMCLGPNCFNITVADAIRFLTLQQQWIFLVPLAADVEAFTASHVVNGEIEWRILASHLGNSLKGLSYQLINLLAFKSFGHK